MKPILVRPLISEKTLTLASRGWYTFVVTVEATKPAIAREISAFYKVTVVEVRTMHMHPKMRRVGKKMKSRQQAEWKKAVVTLKSGQKIDVFEVTGAPPAEESKK